MIRDAKNVFKAEMAVTDADVNSDNLIFENGEIGQGEPKRFYFHVDEAFVDAAGGDPAGTVTMRVQAGDGTTYHDLVSSPAMDAGDLIAGFTWEGYLSTKIGGTHIRAELGKGGTKAFTAGKITAGLRY